MAKYYSSVIAQKVSGAAIEWAGGVGFTRETGIEKYWRDSKIVSADSALTVVLGRSSVAGRDIRRYIKYTATDDCKVHPEGIFMRPNDQVGYICMIPAAILLLEVCLMSERTTVTNPVNDRLISEYLLLQQHATNKVNAEGCHLKWPNRLTGCQDWVGVDLWK